MEDNAFINAACLKIIGNESNTISSSWSCLPSNSLCSSGSSVWSHRLLSLLPHRFRFSTFSLLNLSALALSSGCNMFLHQATSAKGREKSAAAVNPGMPLRQADLHHAAPRLTSIAHIRFLLGTQQNQDVQIKKQSAPWYGWREKTQSYWTFIFTYLQKEVRVHSWKGLFTSAIFPQKQLQRIRLSVLPVCMSCLYVTDVLIRCSW